MTVSVYSWVMLGSIGLSLGLWTRVARRDRRLPFIYLAALAGAFIGAKVVYFFAEGFLHLGTRDMWLQLATGKSILGGLLGGYAGVELAKHVMGYQQVTGDWFALVAPVGIMFGRVGCWVHGCCQGVACQPAWYTVSDRTGLRKTKRLPGQHFHLYLIGYGGFRFFHEFLREEPRLVIGLTGYQIASLAVLALGVIGFLSRKRAVEALLAGSTVE
jgi:phosphatidylglycerol:prolipoprotein diacylglycerol transferase